MKISPLWSSRLPLVLFPIQPSGDPCTLGVWSRMLSCQHSEGTPRHCFWCLFQDRLPLSYSCFLRDSIFNPLYPPNFGKTGLKFPQLKTKCETLLSVTCCLPPHLRHHSTPTFCSHDDFSSSVVPSHLSWISLPLWVFLPGYCGPWFQQCCSCHCCPHGSYQSPG